MESRRGAAGGWGMEGLGGEGGQQVCGVPQMWQNWGKQLHVVGFRYEAMLRALRIWGYSRPWS